MLSLCISYTLLQYTLVESDAQLMETVLCVVLRPLLAGILRANDYEWSSFRSYLQDLIDQGMQMTANVFGGKRNFMELHHESSDEQAHHKFATFNGKLDIKCRALADSEAADHHLLLLRKDSAGFIAMSSKENRNKAIRRLGATDLLIKQIERFAGIDRGTIQERLSEI